MQFEVASVRDELATMKAIEGKKVQVVAQSFEEKIAQARAEQR